MGLGGSVVKTLANHDENVRNAAVIAEQLKQRNDRIDNTLDYHGKQIYTINGKIDVIGQKLDVIEALEKQKQ